MFGLGLATKIYVAIEAVDMRKGFEGLYGLVRDQLGAGPAERTSVPILESHAHAFESPGVGWQRTMGVREAAGERPLPLACGSEKRRSVTMRAEELAMLVNGLDLEQAQPAQMVPRARRIKQFQHLCFVKKMVWSARKLSHSRGFSRNIELPHLERSRAHRRTRARNCTGRS